MHLVVGLEVQDRALQFVRASPHAHPLVKSTPRINYNYYFPK